MEPGAIFYLLKSAFVSLKFKLIIVLTEVPSLFCLVLPCANQPPPAPPGEGAERIYNVDITNYRCPNGYMWETGNKIIN
jgi:hypothetical protein